MAGKSQNITVTGFWLNAERVVLTESGEVQYIDFDVWEKRRRLGFVVKSGANNDPLV